MPLKFRNFFYKIVAQSHGKKVTFVSDTLNPNARAFTPSSSPNPSPTESHPILNGIVRLTQDSQSPFPESIHCLVPIDCLTPIDFGYWKQAFRYTVAMYWECHDLLAMNGHQKNVGENKIGKAMSQVPRNLLDEAVRMLMNLSSENVRREMNGYIEIKAIKLQKALFRDQNITETAGTFNLSTFESSLLTCPKPIRLSIRSKAIEKFLVENQVVGRQERLRTEKKALLDALDNDLNGDAEEKKQSPILFHFSKQIRISYSETKFIAVLAASETFLKGTDRQLSEYL